MMKNRTVTSNTVRNIKVFIFLGNVQIKLIIKLLKKELVMNKKTMPCPRDSNWTRVNHEVVSALVLACGSVPVYNVDLSFDDDFLYFERYFVVGRRSNCLFLP